jgi:uncharacterized membrane protein YqgA involved in biofilm formation
MIGTIVNTGAIIVGSTAGLLLKKGIPERFSDTIKKTLGLATLVLGIAGVMAGMLKSGKDGVISSQNQLFIILCLVIGAVIGEIINIDKWFNAFGDLLQRLFWKRQNNFSMGFITASLIYCVGAMAILGSLQDGLSNDPTILFEKSILDGIMSVLLASTFGVGVLLSAGTVLLYQGTFTLFAVVIKPYVSTDVLTQMSMVGSALIICIGLNLLETTKIKTANLIPATFLPIIIGIFKNFV